MDMQPLEIGQTEGAEDDRIVDRVVGRRIVLAGVAGLGMASLIGLNVALAQDSTDDTESEDDNDIDGSDDVDTEIDAEVGAAYQNFLGKLTTNLGMTDTSEVDLAIRASLKAMVDEKFTEGSISQNDADAIKERIDTGVSPLGVAMLGGVRGRRQKRRDERRDNDTGSDTDPAETLPAATPTV